LFNNYAGDLLNLGKSKQTMSFTDFITDNGRIINKENFILEGIREGLDEEELFEKFRKAKYLKNNN